MKSKSTFLSNLHYFYAQTDGTYAFPNSAEGDLLKTAKKEIEALIEEKQWLRETLSDEAKNYFDMAQVRLPELLRENTKIREENESLKKLLHEIQDWMVEDDYEYGPVGAGLYEEIGKHLSK